MLIDIHRHAKDAGAADRVVRNLFHNQTSEIEEDKFYSVGLHPWHVDENTIQEDLKMVEDAASYPQVIAIGETGLDKTIKTSLETQSFAFYAQIDIARKLEKPLIIHCVRAYNEVFTLKINANIKQPWIIHWFNANRQMGEQLTEKGFYLSFGHLLFHDRSKAYHAFPNLPIEKLFFETDDSEYSIDEVYKKAALLKGINWEILQKQIESNFKHCFGLEP
ncbi:MAG: TatD family hydrolase [Bacteroidales bacterium]|nr:TatD family hydrolase [Bacteroidales bacterium]